MELRDYLQMLWRRRWLIVLAMIVTAGSALGLSYQITPEYVATSKVFVGPRSVDEGDVGSALQELYFSRELTASYAEVLRSRGIAERAIREAEVEASPADLASRIQTNLIPNTRIIEIEVTDPSPQTAQLLANAIAEVFVNDTDGTYGGGTSVSASVLERALLPTSPISPKPVQNGLIGGLLGLGLGVGVTFLLEQLDLRLRSRADVERVLSPLPILGVIPTTEVLRKRRNLFFKDESNSPAAESFRILRTNIQYLGIDDPVRRILVTSPGAEEGKSTVAANLAASYALAGFDTALVETDLRRPVAHEYFGMTAGPGISDILVGAANNLDKIVKVTPLPKLILIEAGTVPPNPTELLGSMVMADVIGHISKESEIQIFDSPPALAVADATVLSSAVEGVLLVVRAGRTHRHRALQAKEAFERMGVRLLGVVVNDLHSSEGYDYYQYSRVSQKDLQRKGLRLKREESDQWEFPAPPSPIPPLDGKTESPAKHELTD